MISSLSFHSGRAVALAGLALLVVGTSCVQNQDHLIVERAVWFSDSNSCSLTGSEPNPVSITADVAYTGPIGMGFVVTNNQSPNANSNTGIDDSEIQILSADVTLTFSGGDVGGGSYEWPVPTNSIAGGSSEVFVIEIPSDVVESLRGAMSGNTGAREILEIEVIFHGRKANQVGNTKIGEIETRPYTYPLEICYDCLTTCLPMSDCGGEGDTLLCPDPSGSEWAGTCGFIQQGTSQGGIIHSSCAS
jgi:hypothetical protein